MNSQNGISLFEKLKIWNFLNTKKKLLFLCLWLAVFVETLRDETRHPLVGFLISFSLSLSLFLAGVPTRTNANGDRRSWKGTVPKGFVFLTDTISWGVDIIHFFFASREGKTAESAADEWNFSSRGKGKESFAMKEGRHDRLWRCSKVRGAFRRRRNRVRSSISLSILSLSLFPQLVLAYLWIFNSTSRCYERAETYFALDKKNR